MTTTVILANVLIAQLSESYAVARANAALCYDITKLNFVTKIENSKLNFMVNIFSFQSIFENKL